MLAELLEGKRVKSALRVAGTVREMAGMNACMRLEDLNRLAREGAVVSGRGLLGRARRRKRALLERLKEMPARGRGDRQPRPVRDFSRHQRAQRAVLHHRAQLFAATIAVGVVYNNARIQLAERSWELASLRVLGFTRREVSVLLLGELAVEIAVAIPLGFLAGFGLAALLVVADAEEVMEFPLVIFPSTYVYAGAVVPGRRRGQRPHRAQSHR